MADKTIGELPSASQVTSGALIPLEQSGVAYKMTGAQFQDWAIKGVSPYATEAASSASAASASAARAANSAAAAASSAASSRADAVAAAGAQQAIENMGVAATTLAPGNDATITKEIVNDVVKLTFGIPRGDVGPQGATGPQGAQGVQGPKGDTGTAVAVETSGMYYFSVDNDPTSATYGHLLLTYTGDEAPSFEIDQTTGHLLWTVEEE